MESKERGRGAAEVITDGFIHSVCRRLAENKPVRRALPAWGRLHIDRQLPFLCVYRRPAARHDAGTRRLVTSEASYLTVSGSRRQEAGVRDLVRAIAGTLSEAFGAFLLIEVWSEAPPRVSETEERDPTRPWFRLVIPWQSDLGAALPSFGAHLERVRCGRRRAEVDISRSAHWSPRRFRPVIDPTAARALNCAVAGLAVNPVYRNPESGEVYPLILRTLRRGLTRALRRSYYDFVRSRTTHLPKHYHVLGRRALVKAVWEVDRQLADVSESFDLLLQLTPTNAARAWREFEAARYEKKPVFHYRPLPVDPVILKRRLFQAPVERIEDPALGDLFREKQDELDRRITLLLDVDSQRFLHGSLQLYGGVEEKLHVSAKRILAEVPARARDASRDGWVDAEGLARRAREEIAYYRSQWSGLKAKVQIRPDVLSGLMVSRGSLIIGAVARVPASRVEALMHHEVGTHVVTYYNGRAQRFRQLYSGLAGYEALQEGIAVLAEYLVGGLSRTRLRLLAGRVVAVRHLVDGASFVETFRMLREAHGFSAASAFSVTLRVYRGGGLTKDAVYLRGMNQLLEYLRQGGILERLFIGKIAIKHVPILRELSLRGVLGDVPLRPRYLDRPDVAERLARLRAGATLDELLAEKGTRRGPSSRPG